MLDIVPFGRVIVLLLLLLPLVSAALVPFFGRAARRAAVWMAVLHLLVATVAVAFTSEALSARAQNDVELDRLDVLRFKPEFVPGDASGRHGAWNRTTWTLLSLSADPVTGDRAGPHVQLFLGLDGLNVWLVLLTSFMLLPAILVSWESIQQRPGAFYGHLFLLQACVIGAFLAFDVILFYVFFELTLIPTFFLIGRWGMGSGRRDAARKFFLYTLTGGLLTLTGIVGIVVTNPTPVHPQTGKPTSTAVTDVFIPDTSAPNGLRAEIALASRGPITFSLPDLMGNVQIWANATSAIQYKVTSLEESIKTQALANPSRQEVEVSAHLLETARRAQKETETFWSHARTVQCWLFLALMAGFLVKVPVWPFHTWLPSAYGESPIGVTILLSALLAKLGTYGILRLVLTLTPDAAILYGLPVVGWLAAVGIVYAALCAYNQKDLKLIIAYSSVSHLGFLLLGLFAFNAEGLSGASLHMLNHGLTIGALFALLAFLLDRYRTTQAAQFGGLMGRFPNFAVLAFVLCLASIGLPGLNNFVSEMLILAGLFHSGETGTRGMTLKAVATLSILLSAWYMLTMMQKVLFNPRKEPATAAGGIPPTDISRRECFMFGSLAGICLVLGLFPQIVLGTFKWDVQQVERIGMMARARVSGIPLTSSWLPDSGMPPGDRPGMGGRKGPAPKGGGKGPFPKGGGKGAFPKGGGKGAFPKGGGKGLENKAEDL